MKVIISVVLASVLSINFLTRAGAQSSSANYSVEESSFSSGSGFGSSANFSAQGSAGDIAVGSAFSTSYRAYSGPISPNEEYLEVVVNSSVINLDTPSQSPGILSETETATGSGTFYVRSYLNSSYVVLTLSQTLTSENNDTIDGMATTGAPVIGTEQFGINLVDNSSPDIGANPVPTPSGSYANGQAATGYGTVNQFKYVAGDVVAQNGGNPAWGQTNYTISYIANISGATDAGNYTMLHELTAVPTF